MKTFLAVLLCAAVLACPGVAVSSDHADPMSLNTFFPQDAPLANITDLHAFVVDKNGSPVRDAARIATGDQLIISLCVRRRLLYWQIDDAALEQGLPEISFRVHLDLDPDVRHHDPARFPDGGLLADERKTLDDAVDAARRTAEDLHRQLDAAPATAAAHSDLESKLTMAQQALDGARQRRDRLLANYQLAARMEALYGGTIDAASRIAEEVTLDFRLKLSREGDAISINVEHLYLKGLAGSVNQIPGSKFDATSAAPAAAPVGSSVGSSWKAGSINVQAGIFDDPFIFPRFFRGNVIGVVTSVPLDLLRRPDGTPAAQGTILLWATTHGSDGKQADHVGRSLRTQLPRFGYLNPLHPSEHVDAILRRHSNPTLLENSLATFLSPLEAHRFYDATPDVMIYDLTRPAGFPNGRWLEDDVAKTLADAGETLLFELSLAESRQFPRATTNDKPFRTGFPFLGDPWSKQESADHALIGTSLDAGFKVPDAPDAGATALPDFSPDVWKSIWWGLFIGLVVAAALAFLALQGTLPRIAVVLVALVGLWLLKPILAKPLTAMEKGFMQQPFEKLQRGLLGSGIVTALGLLAVYAAGIRHGGKLRASRSPHASLLAEEGETLADRQYDGSTYQEVHDAVFRDPYSGTVPWGSPNTTLPVYHIPLGTLAKGLLLRSLRSPFREASLRTIASHADLRWGENRQGVQRLLHPHGICLAGTWRITRDTEFTGYFAKGRECPIIARYSSEERLRNKPRTLSLVGKLFPTQKPGEKVHTANFITQSALGGVRSESIFDVHLRNAPDVVPLASGIAFVRLMLSLLAFRTVDSHKTERQLYEIAEAGTGPTPDGTATNCPRYMQLSIVSPQVVSDGSTSDFREDILAQMYKRGDSALIQPLVFKIEVSKTGRMKGIFNRTLVETSWDEIGVIEFTEAVASYNGDFVIHFHHPKWRDPPK